MQILHLTAHLGGGVGKALSDLIANRHGNSPVNTHRIVTFEKTEKSAFIDRIIKSGAEIIVQPGKKELARIIESTDIVQLEWWNHPATLQALCGQHFPPMRLVVWSHVSGLHTPVIPGGLVEQSNRFLLTSACSLQTKTIINLPSHQKKKVCVVNSCGGLESVSSAPVLRRGALSVGYIGSLNFSKLHPDYVDFISSIPIAGLKVKLYGDLNNKAALENQCSDVGKPDLLEFKGYVNDVSEALSGMNVFAYLLNPNHYGTTENALLEAMAAGVVPVVLDNPAERCIVEHLQTGIIVCNRQAFSSAIQWLAQNPEDHRRISRNASKAARAQYSADKLTSAFNHQYRLASATTKKDISFTHIFGKTPSDWFLSCQERPDIFKDKSYCGSNLDRYSGYGLCEPTKGSIFHFLKYFNGDRQLKSWAGKLKAAVSGNHKLALPGNCEPIPGQYHSGGQPYSAQPRQNENYCDIKEAS